MACVSGTINKRLRAKVKKLVKQYHKGDTVEPRKLAFILEQDRRVSMHKGRIGAFLKEFDNLVRYDKGRWVRI